MMSHCYILIGALVLSTAIVTIKADEEDDEAKEEIESRTLLLRKVIKVIGGLFVQSQPECLSRAAVRCYNQIDTISIALCGVNFLRQNTRCNQQQIIHIG